MKEIEVSGRSVKIDIEKLSQGLCEMHNEDENIKARLAFGMLDLKLCELMNDMLKERVLKQFSTEAYDLHKLEIDTFIKEASAEISKGVYKYAKMIV